MNTKEEEKFRRNTKKFWPSQIHVHQEIGQEQSTKNVQLLHQQRSNKTITNSHRPIKSKNQQSMQNIDAKSLETTKPQTDLQCTQSKEKGSSKQGKLFRILGHRQKGRAHQQRTKESKGNLQIQHVKALRLQFSHGGFTQIHENRLMKHEKQERQQQNEILMTNEKTINTQIR